MVAPKRKENPNSAPHTGSTLKRPRKEEKLVNGLKDAHDLETATDSDPIVESDTTSQSGDDDGVSWPSDEKVEADEDGEGVEIANDKEDGGVKIAEEARASKSAEKVPSTKDTTSGMLE